jgi:ribosomal protein L37AE/L43A
VTLVVDIACPSCGRTRTLRKVAIGTYRCGDCGRAFTEGEIDPSP